MTADDRSERLCGDHVRHELRVEEAIGREVGSCSQRADEAGQDRTRQAIRRDRYGGGGDQLRALLPQPCQRKQLDRGGNGRLAAAAIEEPAPGSGELHVNLGSFVGVQHDVVTGLRNRCPCVVEPLAIEVDRLRDADEHRSYERDVLRPVT